MPHPQSGGQEGACGGLQGIYNLLSYTHGTVDCPTVRHAYLKVLWRSMSWPCLLVMPVLVLRSCVELCTEAMICCWLSISIKIRFLASCSCIRMTFSVPCSIAMILIRGEKEQPKPVPVVITTAAQASCLRVCGSCAEQLPRPWVARQSKVPAPAQASCGLHKTCTAAVARCQL